jgi:large subunit ribosomal protein L22
MGRAYRYQRRLTHIVVSVAERNGGKSLVTRAEEPVAAAKPAKKATTRTAKKAPAKKPVAKKKAARK